MIPHGDVYTGTMTGGARIGAAILAVALASACSSSGSPTTPGTSPSPNIPPPSGHIVTGTAVSALTEAAAASITISAGSTPVALTAGDGTFTAGFSTGGNNRITLSGAGFVTRETGIQAPSLALRLSLIPAEFNLAAFNQMFRHTSGPAGPMLARWKSPPGLLIERRVLQFTDLNAASYAALTEIISAGDVATLVTDLTDGYAQLTDGKLGTFTSVTSQTTASGGAVAVSNPGRIVVTRVEGLTAATQFWGYARWSTTPDGEVTRGFIMVDAAFARSGSPFKRSLHMHELGHTLGCQHVSGIASVMNSNAQTTPNAFDQGAARIAMLRPVGNRAPDIDPAGHAATTASRASALPRWHGAH